MKNSKKNVQMREILEKFLKKDIFRLWHQLTTELRADLDKPQFVANLNLKDLYDKFDFIF